MKCPIDNIELQEKQGEGFAYHQCSDCEGLWMRHRALRTLVQKYKPNADVVMPRPADAYVLGKASSKSDTNNITQCPLDGSDYYEHAFGSVIMDICPKCDGIWLDKGEMAKVKDELQNSSVETLFIESQLNDLAAFFGDFFSRSNDDKKE